MTLTRKGKHWYGSEDQDIRAAIQRFSEGNGYPATEYRASVCVCGSTLFWRSTQSPDVIAVTLGTLEPPYDGPVQRELYTDTKPAWLPVR